MSRNRIILAIGAILMSATAALAGAQIKWLRTSHNFGAFNENQGVVSTRIPYVNTGDEELVIIAARASCGCTSPRFDNTTLAPGDTAYLTVSFDPAGRPGRFNKKITVDTNTEPQRSTLHITGVVIGAPATVKARYPIDMGPLKFSVNTALLGEAKKMHAKTVFLDGYNMSADSIAPQVVDTPKWLDVTPGPKLVPPGERVSFNFLIRPDNTPLYGFVSDSVTIIPDSRHPEQRYILPVVVNIGDDFSKLSAEDYKRAPVAQISTPGGDASAIRLGEQNAGTGAKTEITLSNSGKSNLMIRRIYSLGGEIVPGKYPDRVKPGKSIRIPLIVNIPEGVLDTRITVITNDPVTPVQTITLTALGN